MRIQIYFRVVGQESQVRQFAARTDMPDAVMHPLKRSASWPPDSVSQLSWVWHTKPIDTDPAGFEATMNRFLKEMSATIALDTDRQLQWVSVVVIVEHEEAEDIPGMYFSAEAIKLIHQLGADLDIDHVRSLDA